MTTWRKAERLLNEFWGRTVLDRREDIDMCDGGSYRPADSCLTPKKY